MGYTLDGQTCPYCSASRWRNPRAVVLVPARVFYLMNIAAIIKSWFADPQWFALWKKGMDVSMNGYRASVKASRLKQGCGFLKPGEILASHNTILGLTNDGFNNHVHSPQTVTGAGIRCDDMSPFMLSSQRNWHSCVLAGPPEPPNFGRVVTELLEELVVLGREWRVDCSCTPKRGPVHQAQSRLSWDVGVGYARQKEAVDAWWPQQHDRLWVVPYGKLMAHPC